MKVFLSHARKDATLARQLAERLGDGGFTVWLSDDEIAPGDNWAKKTGKALDEAEMMVILLTPTAMQSDALQRDIEYMLSTEKFEGRMFSVFVGPTVEAGKDVPWILLKLPHQIVGSAAGFGGVVKQIKALRRERHVSHSNA